MKGNLAYILGWVAYEARISALSSNTKRGSYCAKFVQLSLWHCGAGVNCDNCPFIRYKQSYLESL